jgi:hypothetical protein
MATDRLQLQMEAIRSLRAEPASEAALAAVRVALAKHPCHVVALAARHAAEFELRTLGPDLVAAYERLAPGGAKSDPGCVGKLALVEALSALDHPDATPFLHAVAHVQLEKGWGPPTDTAGGLRGHALMGLVGVEYPDTPLLIADRLADPEPRCRAAAARCALAWGDRALGQALLRLRLRVGERDPDVLAELFAALLALGGSPAADFVAGQLVGADVVSESAALALGSARVAGALPPLIAWWKRVDAGGGGRVALVAIGLLRSSPALEFLLARLATGDEAAMPALEVYLPDPAAAARIRAVAAEAGVDFEG